MNETVCVLCVTAYRRRVWRTSTSTTGDNVMWRGLERTNSSTWITFVVWTEKAQDLSPGSSSSTLFCPPVRDPVQLSLK